MEHPLRVARGRGALTSLDKTTAPQPECMSTNPPPPAPADHNGTSCRHEAGQRHDGITHDVPVGRGFLIHRRCRDSIIRWQHKLLRGACRQNGNREAASGRARQAARAGDQRSSEASGSGGRDGCNDVHVRSTQRPAPWGDARVICHFALILIVHPAHPEDLPWLSNSTECRQKNCRL